MGAGAVGGRGAGPGWDRAALGETGADGAGVEGMEEGRRLGRVWRGQGGVRVL